MKNFSRLIASVLVITCAVTALPPPPAYALRSTSTEQSPAGLEELKTALGFRGVAEKLMRWAIPAAFGILLFAGSANPTQAATYKQGEMPDGRPAIVAVLEKGDSAASVARDLGTPLSTVTKGNRRLKGKWRQLPVGAELKVAQEDVSETKVDQLLPGGAASSGTRTEIIRQINPDIAPMPLIAPGAQPGQMIPAYETREVAVPTPPVSPPALGNHLGGGGSAPGSGSGGSGPGFGTPPPPIPVVPSLPVAPVAPVAPVVPPAAPQLMPSPQLPSQQEPGTSLEGWVIRLALATVGLLVGGLAWRRHRQVGQAIAWPSVSSPTPPPHTPATLPAPPLLTSAQISANPQLRELLRQFSRQGIVWESFQDGDPYILLRGGQWDIRIEPSVGGQWTVQVRLRPVGSRSGRDPLFGWGNAQVILQEGNLLLQNVQMQADTLALTIAGQKVNFDAARIRQMAQDRPTGSEVDAARTRAYQIILQRGSHPASSENLAYHKDLNNLEKAVMQNRPAVALEILDRGGIHPDSPVRTTVMEWIDLEWRARASGNSLDDQTFNRILRGQPVSSLPPAAMAPALPDDPQAEMTTLADRLGVIAEQINNLFDERQRLGQARTDLVDRKKILQEEIDHRLRPRLMSNSPLPKEADMARHLQALFSEQGLKLPNDPRQAWEKTTHIRDQQVQWSAQALLVGIWIRRLESRMATLDTEIAQIDKRLQTLQSEADFQQEQARLRARIQQLRRMTAASAATGLEEATRWQKARQQMVRFALEAVTGMGGYGGPVATLSMGLAAATRSGDLPQSLSKLGFVAGMALLGTGTVWAVRRWRQLHRIENQRKPAVSAGRRKFFGGMFSLGITGLGALYASRIRNPGKDGRAALTYLGGKVREKNPAQLGWPKTRQLLPGVSIVEAQAVTPLWGERSLRDTYVGVLSNSARYVWKMVPLEHRRLESVEEILDRVHGGVAATNGGLYHPGGEPTGLYVFHGQERHPWVEPRTIDLNGIFAVRLDGTIEIASAKDPDWQPGGRKYERRLEDYLVVEQVGPIGILNGEVIVSAEHPRQGGRPYTMWIMDEDGHLTPFIVNGAMGISGPSYRDAAAMAKQIYEQRTHKKVASLIFADGGGSTTTAYLDPESGRPVVVRGPARNPAREALVLIDRLYAEPVVFLNELVQKGEQAKAGRLLMERLGEGSLEDSLVLLREIQSDAELYQILMTRSRWGEFLRTQGIAVGVGSPSELASRINAFAQAAVSAQIRDPQEIIRDLLRELIVGDALARQVSGEAQGVLKGLEPASIAYINPYRLLQRGPRPHFTAQLFQEDVSGLQHLFPTPSGAAWVLSYTSRINPTVAARWVRLHIPQGDSSSESAHQQAVLEKLSVLARSPIDAKQGQATVILETYGRFYAEGELQHLLVLILSRHLHQTEDGAREFSPEGTALVDALNRSATLAPVVKAAVDQIFEMSLVPGEPMGPPAPDAPPQGGLEEETAWEEKRDEWKSRLMKDGWQEWEAVFREMIQALRAGTYPATPEMYDGQIIDRALVSFSDSTADVGAREAARELLSELAWRVYWKADPGYGELPERGVPAPLRRGRDAIRYWLASLVPESPHPDGMFEEIRQLQATLDLLWAMRDQLDKTVTEVRAVRGKWSPSATFKGQLPTLLFHNQETTPDAPYGTLPWALLSASVGVTVAVVTDTEPLAEEMRRLFQESEISSELYQIISAEEVGSFERAFETVGQGVELKYPALSVIQMRLEELGLVFASPVQAGLEEIRRYLDLSFQA